MRRIAYSLLVGFLIASMAGQGWAATVYGKLIGGAFYYQSGATSFDDVTTDDTSGDVEAAWNAAGAGGTLYLNAGTYSGTQIDSADGLDPTANGQRLIGVGEVVIDGRGVADEVFETGAFDSGMVQNIIFLADDTNTRILYIADGATEWTISGCTFKGPKFATIYSAGATTHVLDGNKFLGVYYAINGYGINIEGAPTVYLTNNIFSPDNNCGGGAVRVRNSATVNVSNNVFIGCNKSCIFTTHATVALNVRNNIFLAHNIDVNPTKSVIDDALGGVIVAENNLWLPFAESPTYPDDLGVVPSSDDLVVSPMLTSIGYNKGYVILTVDDASAESYTYAQDVADLCDELGIKFTWYVDWDRLATNAGYADVIQNMHSRGHEIGNHSKTHTDMTAMNAEQLIVEIDDVTTLLESTIGGTYRCQTFACPGNLTDETVQDAIKDSGLIGARGGSTGGRLLSNIEVYNIRTPNTVAIFGDKSEAVLARNGAALAAMAVASGKIYALLSHNAAELSIYELGVFLGGVLSVPGIEVVTMAEAIGHIRNSGNWTDADSDSERWTRIFTDASDYSLMPGSPCINAGTEASAVGMAGEQTDGLGVTRTLPGLYNLNIGVDQTKFHHPAIQGGKILGGKLLGE